MVERSTIWLPLVTTSGIAPTTGPTPPIPLSIYPCNMVKLASDMLTLLLEASWQEHPLLICDLRLTRAAQARAVDMAARNYFSHTSPEGITANEWARQFGCKLPSEYETRGNQIESLVAGTDVVSIALSWLKESRAHYEHVAGMNDFFRAQDRIGIGMARDIRGWYGIYWVVLIARLEN